MRIDLAALLAYAKEEGASDLHLSTGLPPMLRLRGSMVRLQMDALAGNDIRDAMNAILTEEQRRRYETDLELDLGFELPSISRVRGNLFVQERGHSAVFRLIPTDIRSLEELGMPPILKKLAMKERGLVVVTGPTGSGKSTTLAAMVDYVNQQKSAHIVTIEDPIEYLHPSKQCLISQREVGVHTHSFAGALRAALREDPDVILLGELRDLETTSLAISAAETGHLVLATLHTNSAAKTVHRIVDIFPGDQQSQIRTMLSDSIEGVVSQTLLVSKDGKSRVPAVEVLVGTPALRNLIREDKTTQIASVIQTSAQHGMQSLDQSLLDLVKQGRISRQEAASRSSNPQQFGVGEAPAAEAGPAGRRPAGNRSDESPARPGLRSS